MRHILLGWRPKDPLGKIRSIGFWKKLLRARSGYMRCSVWCFYCKSHREVRKEHKVFNQDLSSSCQGRNPYIQFQVSKIQPRTWCIVYWLLCIQDSLGHTSYKLSRKGKSEKDMCQGTYHHNKAGRAMLGLLSICGTLMASSEGKNCKGNCSLKKLTGLSCCYLLSTISLSE